MIDAVSTSGNEKRQLWRKRSAASAVLLSIALLCSTSLLAQSEIPPPVSTLPKADRERLEGKPDIKDRTKTAVEMMNFRLANAERHRTSENYDEVFRELGVFQGLVDNTLDLLLRRTGGKGLDNLKRLEMALRTFIPRLEAIRREIPSEYEGYVDKLMRSVRDARSKATEPMFSDNVVPNARPGN